MKNCFYSKSNAKQEKFQQIRQLNWKIVWNDFKKMKFS